MKRIALCSALILLLTSAAAETKYYYNPDGGAYYHAAPECPSMSKKYYPTLQQVKEGELAQEPFAALRPCRICIDTTGKTEVASQEDPALSSIRIGVDIRQGLYQIDAVAGAEVVIQDWDGTEVKRIQENEDWQVVIRLRNEQTLNMTEGVSLRLISYFNVSSLDTGTRGLCIMEPGIYCTHRHLDPGLYLVEAFGNPEDAVIVRDTAAQRVIWETIPVYGAQNTVYLGSGTELMLPEGCCLKSFKGGMIIQTEPVQIHQGRYLAGQELPMGDYTVQPLPGKDGCCCVTDVHGVLLERFELREGESLEFDLYRFGNEVFVEFNNCVVTFHTGNHG